MHKRLLIRYPLRYRGESRGVKRLNEAILHGIDRLLSEEIFTLDNNRILRIMCFAIVHKRIIRSLLIY